MAYVTRRRSSYRAAPARRSYGSARRTPRARTGARRNTRSGGSRAQTLKIVIEQVPASSISRPAGAPLQVEAPGPKKSKF